MTQFYLYVSHSAIIVCKPIRYEAKLCSLDGFSADFMVGTGKVVQEYKISLFSLRKKVQDFLEFKNRRGSTELRAPSVDFFQNVTRQSKIGYVIALFTCHFLSLSTFQSHLIR